MSAKKAVARRDAAAKILQHEDAALLGLLARREPEAALQFEERLIDALRDQQQAWAQYKNYECALIGTLGGGASLWQSTRSVICEANLVEGRVVRIRSARRCLKNLAPKKRPFDGQSCLYQLAPLAVPRRR